MAARARRERQRKATKYRFASEQSGAEKLINVNLGIFQLEQIHRPRPSSAPPPTPRTRRHWTLAGRAKRPLSSSRSVALIVAALESKNCPSQKDTRQKRELVLSLLGLCSLASRGTHPEAAEHFALIKRPLNVLSGFRLARLEPINLAARLRGRGFAGRASSGSTVDERRIISCSIIIAMLARKIKRSKAERNKTKAYQAAAAAADRRLPNRAQSVKCVGVPPMW